MSNDLLKELDTRRTTRRGDTEYACTKAAAAIRALVAALRPFGHIGFPPEFRLEDVPPNQIIGVGVTPEELQAILTQLEIYPLPPKEPLQ